MISTTYFDLGVIDLNIVQLHECLWDTQVGTSGISA